MTSLPKKRSVISKDATKASQASSCKFKCDVCSRLFTHKKQLLVHAYNHKENPKFDCQDCGKAFTSKNAFERHANTHLKEKKNTIPCKICKTECLNRAELEEHHRKNHLKEKVFTCEICNAEFSWEENLHRHKRNHLIDNYQCELCSKVFVDTISLRIHMRNHNKVLVKETDKSFQCKKCGKCFQYDFSYQAHLRHHVSGATETNSPSEQLSQDGISSGTNSLLNSSTRANNGKSIARNNASAAPTALKQALKHAKVIPAVKAPKNFKPYPRMTQPEKDTLPEQLPAKVADYRVKKDAKAKTKSTRTKPNDARFGELSMTTDTPFRCYLCKFLSPYHFHNCKHNTELN